MKILRRTSILFLAGCLLLSLAACAGDDGGDSPEAKLDRAVEALNSNDPDKAIAELSPSPDFSVTIANATDGDAAAITKVDAFTKDFPEEASLLASAYVQQSGFDTLNLIKEIADNEESSPDSGSIIFKATTQMFKVDTNGNILDLDNKLTPMNSSVGLLSSLLKTTPAGIKSAASKAAANTPATDWQTQLGIYSAIDSILVIYKISDLQYKLGKFYYSTLDADNWAFYQKRIERNLQNIRKAAEVLAATFGIGDDESDIKAEFDKWLVDIGYATKGPGGITYDELTFAELDAYLKKLAAK